MSATTIRTMQDLLDALDGLGYSKSVINQIRPQIKRCAQVYRKPLDGIAADLESFEEKWGRGRIATVTFGFGSFGEFKEWRRRVRAALGRVFRPVEPNVALLPAWQTLITFVSENGGVGKPVPPHLAESIGPIARVASASGLAPSQIGGAWMDAAGSKLTGRARRTWRCGHRSLNGLVRRRDELAEIASLLPADPLPPLSRGKAAPASWRRRGGLSEARRIWAEFDEFVDWKRGKDELGRPLPAEKSKFKKRSAESYEDTLTAALGELERIGWLRPGDAPGLADICAPGVIEIVHNAWVERALEAKRSLDPETLHTLVSRLSHIAIKYIGVKKSAKKDLRKLTRKVRKRSGSTGQMSMERLRWIKSFAASPAQQRVVDTMPEVLMREASKILAHWDRLKAARRRKTMMTALSLGIAACIAALLFRGSPVRAANARTFRHEGENATLFIAEEYRGAEIDIPAEEVKNGERVQADCDDDALPVLKWYVEEIRPRLIADHPYGHKLVDGNFLFPSKGAGAMEETTFAKHYARGCEFAGIDMVLHQARHVSAYIILDADPNAWAAAAAVLCDSVETTKLYYAWMDTRKAGAEGRRILHESRRARRRHRKGAVHA